MTNATRLTNLEITGDLEVKGKEILSGLTQNTYKVSSADATEAASTAPTKAEFDAVVTLVNEIKTDYNKLLKKLCTGSDS